MIEIQNIGLYISSRRSDLDACVQHLCNFLDSRSISYSFENSSYAQLPDNLRKTYHSTFSADDMQQPIDLVVVVGGDGSFLHACKLFYRREALLTGINLGRLGFLTDIWTDQIERLLGHILDGEGDIEKRYFFAGKLGSHTFYALNDLVIQAADASNIIDVEVMVGGTLAFELRCDGIIVASSTGSTAYGLSAGGPLLHPDVQGLVLVPLAAHTLSARPCVIPDNKELQIRHISIDQEVRISVDGTVSGKLKRNQLFSIRKSSRSIRLVHPPGYDYFAACREKLGWQGANY